MRPDSGRPHSAPVVLALVVGTCWLAAPLGSAQRFPPCTVEEYAITFEGQAELANFCPVTSSGVQPCGTRCHASLVATGICCRDGAGRISPPRGSPPSFQPMECPSSSTQAVIMRMTGCTDGPNMPQCLETDHTGPLVDSCEYFLSRDQCSPHCPSALRAISTCCAARPEVPYVEMTRSSSSGLVESFYPVKCERNSLISIASRNQCSNPFGPTSAPAAPTTTRGPTPPTSSRGPERAFCSATDYRRVAAFANNLESFCPRARIGRQCSLGCEQTFRAIDDCCGDRVGDVLPPLGVSGPTITCPSASARTQLRQFVFCDNGVTLEACEETSDKPIVDQCLYNGQQSPTCKPQCSTALSGLKDCCADRPVDSWIDIVRDGRGEMVWQCSKERSFEEVANANGCPNPYGPPSGTCSGVEFDAAIEIQRHVQYICMGPECSTACRYGVDASRKCCGKRDGARLVAPEGATSTETLFCEDDAKYKLILSALRCDYPPAQTVLCYEKEGEAPIIDQCLFYEGTQETCSPQCQSALNVLQNRCCHGRAVGEWQAIATSSKIPKMTWRCSYDRFKDVSQRNSCENPRPKPVATCSDQEYVDALAITKPRVRRNAYCSAPGCALRCKQGFDALSKCCRRALGTDAGTVQPPAGSFITSELHCMSETAHTNEVERFRCDRDMPQIHQCDQDSDAPILGQCAFEEGQLARECTDACKTAMSEIEGRCCDHGGRNGKFVDVADGRRSGLVWKCGQDELDRVTLLNGCKAPPTSTNDGDRKTTGSASSGISSSTVSVLLVFGALAAAAACVWLVRKRREDRAWRMQLEEYSSL